MYIEDGTGDRYQAEVDSTHRLKVRSVSEAMQHVISHNDGQAYQVSDTITLAATTQTALYLKNTSTDKKLVVTYMRVQMIDPAGGTAPPGAGDYFDIGFGRLRTSGGTQLTPVNVHRGSPNEAEVDAYGDAPTMSGTFVEIDRWYVQAEGVMMVWNKEGSVVLDPGQAMEIRITSTNTSGTAYARISFFMESDW